MHIDNPLLRGFAFAPFESAGMTGPRDKSGGGGREFDDSEIPDDDDGGGIAVDDEPAPADEAVEDEAPVEDAPEAEDDGSLAARVEPEPEPEPLAQLAQYGLPTDPNQLRAYAEQSRQAQQQAQELQRQLQWYAWQAQQQQQAQQAAAQQKPPPKVFDLPEFQQDWMQLVEQDANGNIVAKSGVDPTLPQKIMAYSKAREQNLNKFLADPIGTIQPHIQGWVQQQAQQIAGNMMLQYHRQNELKNYEREAAEWAFNDGKSAASGLTAAGQTWNRHYQQALQLGYPNAIEYAERMLNADLYPILLDEQIAQQNGQQAVQTRATRDMDLLRRGARQTNRSGSVQAPGGKRKSVSPVKNETPKQFSERMFKARLKARLKDLPDEELETK